MKRSALKVACTLLFLFLLCGTGNADVYTNTVNFTDDTILVGSPSEGVSGVLLFGYDLFGYDTTYTWQHAVTSDFSVPYDTVNRATLSINGWGIGGENDYVYVESTLQGFLEGDSGAWRRSGWIETTTDFDLGNIFVTWTAGTPLDVSLDYTDLAGGFLLTKSVFSLTYENGEAPTVPIPGTLLMLGTGLIGLLCIRRRITAG